MRWLARLWPAGAHRGDPRQKARKKHPRRWHKAGRELTSDAEAFLLGHLAEHYLQQTGEAPVWAWTNLLAHGTEEELRADAFGTPKWTAWTWHEARSYLAGEVLGCAKRYGSLTQMQGRLLVPLELDLASCEQVSHWSPGHWATVVEEALAGHSFNPIGSHEPNDRRST